MNILYIAFSPIDTNNSASIRNRAILAGMMKLGHRIDVVTTKSWNGGEVANLDFLTQLNKIYRINENYRAESNKSFSLRPGSANILSNFIRTLYHLFFIYDSYYLILRKKKSYMDYGVYDVVISSSDPKSTHLFVRKYRNKLFEAKTWIQYWGDPLSTDITRKWLYPKKIVLHAEKRLVRLADKVIYVSPFTLTSQMALFNDKSLNLKFLPTPFEKRRFLNKVSLGYKVSYHGWFDKNVRNIMPFYESVDSLKSLMTFEIIGSGDSKIVTKDGVKVLSFTEDIIHHEDSTDLFIVILNHSGNQIPGKIYYLAGTNRPILVILDGEHSSAMRTYLESYERFYFCSNNTNDIVKSLIMIHEEKKKFKACETLFPEAISKDFLC